jgi:hypothetical protein
VKFLCLDVVSFYLVYLMIWSELSVLPLFKKEYNVQHWLPLSIHSESEGKAQNDWVIFLSAEAMLPISEVHCSVALIINLGF